MENIIFQKLIIEQKPFFYELSKRSGVPYSTINDLLHDKKNISNISGKNLYLIKTTSDFLLKPVFYEEIDLFKRMTSEPMTTWVEKLSLYIFWVC